MDYTHLIERLEAFEERLGIRLEALFAYWSENIYSPRNSYFKLNGELHPKDGTALQEDIVLVVDIYDNSGRLVAHNGDCFRKEGFFGFRTFEMGLQIDIANPIISKIRVYPRAL